MRCRMRWCCGCLAAVIAASVLVPAAQAQDTGDLKKMYQDALAQLKESQDRKNELASENSKLTARVADLEKQVATARQQVADYQQRTFFLRAHYAAWQVFVQDYPGVLDRWRQYIGDMSAGTGALDEMTHPLGPPPMPAIAPHAIPEKPTKPPTTSAAPKRQGKRPGAP